MEQTEVVVKLTDQSASLVRRAQACNCQDAVAYSEAGVFVTDLQALKKEVKETFGPMKRKTDAAHKEVCTQESSFLKPIDEALRTVKTRMSGYLQVQEQARRAKQARLEAEARKAEEDRRLEAAAALEAAGHQEEAERVLEEPQVEAPPPPVAAPPKVAGISSRDKWTAEVTDFAALVRSVASGKAPLAVLSVDQSAVNKLASTHQERLDVPGLKVRCEKIIAARASGG